METANLNNPWNPLLERLLLTFITGQGAGGDKRGQLSAALATIAERLW